MHLEHLLARYEQVLNDLAGVMSSLREVEEALATLTGGVRRRVIGLQYALGVEDRLTEQPPEVTPSSEFLPPGEEEVSESSEVHQTGVSQDEGGQVIIIDPSERDDFLAV